MVEDNEWSDSLERRGRDAARCGAKIVDGFDGLFIPRTRNPFGSALPDPRQSRKFCHCGSVDVDSCGRNRR
jgi:hypothetical protein